MWLTKLLPQWEEAIRAHKGNDHAISRKRDIGPRTNIEAFLLGKAGRCIRCTEPNVPPHRVPCSIAHHVPVTPALLHHLRSSLPADLPAIHALSLEDHTAP